MRFPNMTECLKRYIFCFAARAPKVFITYAWFISLFFVAIAFVVACVATSYVEESSDTQVDSISSFAVMWTALMLVFISIVGTIIMRRFQTGLSIGFLLGIVFIMANQMLIIFAMFADRAQTDETKKLRDINAAVATFSFFLAVVYSIFGILLTIFRFDVVKVEQLMSEEDEDYEDTTSVELPPENI